MEEKYDVVVVGGGAAAMINADLVAEDTCIAVAHRRDLFAEKAWEERYSAHEACGGSRFRTWPEPTPATSTAGAAL